MIRLSQERPLLCVPALLITAFCATALAGNTQRDAARAAARSAGYEGIHAYQTGDMAVAVDKLGRAFDAVKIPTLGLWYARALAKTGNWVEASERYGEVIRLEVTEGKLKEQKQAQADAASELEALKPRIPTLTLMIPGASEECQVTLDGGALSQKLLDLAAPINPGRHRIEAKQAGETVEATFTIAEGERKVLTLKFPDKPRHEPSAALSASPSRPGARASLAARSEGRAPPNTKRQGSTQMTLGWMTLGLGGAATAVGAVTGLLVLTKRNQLDDSNHCTGTVCSSVEADRVESYRQMRTVSSIGFVAGAVGIGVGTTLLLTTPKPKDTIVAAWVGIGSVGMKGNF